MITHHHWDEFLSSFTSYIIAFFGMASLNKSAVVLGLLLGIVRLSYDTLRLIRYIRNPENEGSSK